MYSASAVYIKYGTRYDRALTGATLSRKRRVCTDRQVNAVSAQSPFRLPGEHFDFPSSPFTTSAQKQMQMMMPTMAIATLVR